MFFDTNLDGDRLQRVCELMLSAPSACESAVSRDEHRATICSLCVRHMHAHTQSSPHTWQRVLRVIESVLQQTQYDNSRCLQALAQADYFTAILHIMNNRVPVPDTPQLTDVSPLPPTALTAELYRYLTLPLKALNSNHSQQLGDVMYMCFGVSVLCSRETAMLHCVLLPMFAKDCASGQLHVPSVFSCLLGDSQVQPSTWFNTTLHNTDHTCTTLPYALLLIVHALDSQIEEWSVSDRLQVLQCVSSACARLDRAVSDSLDAQAQADMDMDTDQPDKAVFDAHELPQQWTPGSAMFGVWHSVQLLNNSSVVSALCDVPVLPEQSEQYAIYTSCMAHIAFLLIQLDVHKYAPMIFRLSFKADILLALWESTTNARTATTSLFGMGSVRLLERVEQGMPLQDTERQVLLPVLGVFCAVLTNTLVPLHDDELWTDAPTNKSSMPFSNKQLAVICRHIRDLALSLVDLAYPDTTDGLRMNQSSTSASRAHVRTWNHMFEVVVELMVRLHKLDCRVGLCSRMFWSQHHRHIIINKKSFEHVGRARQGRALFTLVRWMTRSDHADADFQLPSAKDQRNVAVLQRMPFVVPFLERVAILNQLLEQEREEGGDEDVVWEGQERAIHVRVRRNYLYEDSFDRLSIENEPSIRRPIRVSMTNWQGVHEPGIDGGGIFREFLNELLKSAFDPGRAFFVPSTHDSLLYPNPAAVLLYPDTFHKHFAFLGRMLGKLIYERQLAELRFAGFFLCKLQRAASDLVDVHQLQSMDPLLYKSLTSLKTDPNVHLLQLDFSLLVDCLGYVQTVQLKPDGKNIRVTNDNKLEYIHLVADFYLNKQMRPMVSAFRLGLSSVLNMDWLAMFDAHELQTLISGHDVDIDLNDMRMHTTVQGTATEEDDQVAARFWRVLYSFNKDQKSALLKFITSCSRPPLFGFKELHPPLAVQITPDVSRLPSAATCMNLLKLPRYGDDQLMHDKLLYAIEFNSGFDLS